MHLAYQERNRARGRPIGQVTLRVEYNDQVGSWFDLLKVAPDEVRVLVKETGWQVERIMDQGEALFAAVLVAVEHDSQLGLQRGQPDEAAVHRT